MARRPVLGNDQPEAASMLPSSLPVRVRIMAALAWAILLAEQLWAALTPAGAVLLLALAAAWSGIPRDLGVWGHVALLGFAAIGFLYALWWGARGFRLPG